MILSAISTGKSMSLSFISARKALHFIFKYLYILIVLNSNVYMYLYLLKQIYDKNIYCMTKHRVTKIS